MDKMETYTRWKQNPSKGEVFTPKSLVNEMLDKIPVEVWENPKSIFCDLSMGKGTFLVEIVKRLTYIYKYSEVDAKSRVFGYENRIKYVNYLRRRGYNNLYHVDTLKEKIDMKFDVVIGNPPYQKKVGPKKTEAIWPKFVEKSFDICKEGGYVSLIHPSGWRDVKGNFSFIKDLLKSKNIVYLNMNDFNTGKEVFGVGTNFDWYTIENCQNVDDMTEINTVDGDIKLFNTNTINYIPNGLLDLYTNLVTKEGEETVEILYSRSGYGTDKKHMSKVRTEEHIYPCVYTITIKDGLKFFFSSINENGHFNIPKLIWSNGLGTYPILDLNGEYGLTQFSYAIVDTPENLALIKKVMESECFIKLMNYVKFTNNKYHYKILATFRKDFWKDFLDEDNNVIEPNYNNVERV